MRPSFAAHVSGYAKAEQYRLDMRCRDAALMTCLVAEVAEARHREALKVEDFLRFARLKAILPLEPTGSGEAPTHSDGLHVWSDVVVVTQVGSR